MNYAIIAAGEGSRLVQEGISLPKPLVDLDGRPMIRRLIDIFASYRPETLSVIVNEQMTEVREYLESIADGLPFDFRLTVRSNTVQRNTVFAAANQNIAVKRSAVHALTGNLRCHIQPCAERHLFTVNYITADITVK